MSDLLNHSLESDDQLQKKFKIVDAENYTRYVSDKVQLKLDILQVIDKNERSFKRIAEKKIEESSQLF
jgi:hypothetical protein